MHSEGVTKLEHRGRFNLFDMRMKYADVMTVAAVLEQLAGVDAGFCDGDTPVFGY